MKYGISAFQHADHRELVRELLKEKGFSYRSFAERHGEIASLDLLASALSKGRGGTKNKPRRDFSPNTLARLGKALKLSEDEIIYSLLLLWENNSEVLPGPHGSVYADCLKKLLREQKIKQFQEPLGRKTGKSQYSLTANTVAQLLDALPPSAKAKLTKGILGESRVVLARQRNKAGVKALTSVIERLGELLAQGAP